MLRPVRATRCYYMCVCVFVLQQALTRVIGKSSTGVFHFLAFYQSALVRARELIYFVYTGWAKKVIPLVQCNVMYERCHFFWPTL